MDDIYLRENINHDRFIPFIASNNNVDFTTEKVFKKKELKTKIVYELSFIDGTTIKKEGETAFDVIKDIDKTIKSNLVAIKRKFY